MKSGCFAATTLPVVVLSVSLFLYPSIISQVLPVTLYTAHSSFAFSSLLSVPVWCSAALAFCYLSVVFYLSLLTFRLLTGKGTRLFQAVATCVCAIATGFVRHSSNIDSRDSHSLPSQSAQLSSASPLCPLGTIALRISIFAWVEITSFLGAPL